MISRWGLAPPKPKRKMSGPVPQMIFEDHGQASALKNSTTSANNRIFKQLPIEEEAASSSSSSSSSETESPPSLPLPIPSFPLSPLSLPEEPLLPSSLPIAIDIPSSASTSSTELTAGAGGAAVKLPPASPPKRSSYFCIFHFGSTSDKPSSGSSSSSWVNLEEIVGFICAALTIVCSVFASVGCWVMFFQYVVLNHKSDDPRATWLHIGIWLALTSTLIGIRTYLTRHFLSRELIRVYRHAECFVAMSLVGVFSTNAAFYLHRQAPTPLYDLGFALVTEQADGSPWRNVSDLMTIGFPILCAIQSLAMSRENRVHVFCTFFRLMTICYGLRALTVPVTSLPGPAPHCRMNSTTYHPPQTWIDIVSRVGPIYGQFNTCGDLIFSGHMCYTNSALLLYLRQLDLRFQRGKVARWIAGSLYLGTLAFLCIAGRKHYTVDVLLGTIISTLVFFHFEHSWIPSAIQQVPLRKTREMRMRGMKEEDVEDVEDCCWRDEQEMRKLELSTTMQEYVC